MTLAVVRVLVPVDEVISLNHRAHWAAVHRQAAALRMRGFAAYRGVGGPRFDHMSADVWVIYPPRHRRRDVANLMGTVKPLMDGIVDAHALPDDDDTHLAGPFLHPWTHATDITPVDDAALWLLAHMTSGRSFGFVFALVGVTTASPVRPPGWAS